jgi:iron(III) transport system substrate-binding protein
MVCHTGAVTDRHRRRPSPVLAVAASTLVGLLGACGAGPGGGHASSLTLYSGQHPETTQAVVSAFEARTGIHVNVRSGDENALVQEIEQEGSNSPADVVYTENSPALMSLEGKGLLEKLPAPTLSAVPAKYDSPAGEWVGVSARASVLVYNTSRLSASQVPTSVLDLADPRWKGKLALAPTETDFEPVVTSIAKARGAQAALSWLKAVRANASGHIEPDNEALTSDVNDGQATIGVVDHYYWYRLAKDVGPSSLHSKISYFSAGDPGFVVDVSGAGVVKSSAHRTEAEELVAFMVSAAGQAALVTSNSFEYPLVPGSPQPPGLEPFSDLQPAPVTVAELGDGSVALRLLQQAQLV